MKSLNLIVLRCRDVEISREFYQCFGLILSKHKHDTGPEHYAHEDERGVFELYPAPPGTPADSTGLGFGTEALEALAVKLTEAGFSPQPIRLNPWGRTFVVRDPDGRRVEVKEVGSAPRAV